MEIKEEEFNVGDKIFHQEDGSISLVEVLENMSDNEGTRLELRVLKNCNCQGVIGSEFYFFRASHGGGFGMASVGKEYPSHHCCNVLTKHLSRLGITYQDVLNYQFDN